VTFDVAVVASKAKAQNHFTSEPARQTGEALLPLPDENDEQDGHALIDTGPDQESASIRRNEQRTLGNLNAGLPEAYSEARARGVLRTRWLEQTEGETRAVS
jgi:hypothetical protein